MSKANIYIFSAGHMLSLNVNVFKIKGTQDIRMYIRKKCNKREISNYYQESSDHCCVEVCGVLCVKCCMLGCVVCVNVW